MQFLSSNVRASWEIKEKVDLYVKDSYKAVLVMPNLITLLGICLGGPFGATATDSHFPKVGTETSWTSLSQALYKLHVSSKS